MWSRVGSLAFVAVMASSRLVHADPHADMAAALRARAEVHPAPATLPVGPPATTRTALVPGVSHIPAWADLGRRAADDAGQQAQAQGQATALAHRAQEAAAAVAGQAQANAAQQRASHPHTR